MDRRLAALFACSVLLLGCKKDETSDAPWGGAPKSADTPAAKPAPDVAPAVLTRLFQCDFVDWQGEGAERQARFALTNKSSEPVKRIQAWVYYYKGPDQIDRYPHALVSSFPPGEKKVLALGAKGEQIKTDVDGAACEITEGTYAGGDKWNNDNLNYNRLMIPRPRDGETHEQLLARTGAKVVATWDGKTGGTARFTLENKSGRPLRAETVWVYYYNASGKQLGRAVANLRLDLATAATSTKELGYPGDKIPEGTAIIEATVSKVAFTDGAKETWINRNLAPFERPMESKPEAAPAPAAKTTDAP